MELEMRLRLRRTILGIACVAALATNAASARAEVLTLPLAQAPAPVKPPSNVTAPSRLYIAEGVVIVLLFGGALFAVCRSSGRT